MPIFGGNPLASETSVERRVDRIQTKTGLSNQEAKMISAAIDLAADQTVPVAEAAKPSGPEAVRGTTLDFIGVAFLERGRRAADAVGRVAFLNGGPQGSGFLVAPGLLLTNHHVISSAAAALDLQVQFDYEHDSVGRLRNSTAFLFDPGDSVPFPLAKNQLAAEGDDPHELRYHHFSIFMNADSRLACLTAVNIDGSRMKAINRRDKSIKDDPTPADFDAESIGAKGAEASDDFRPDRRILPEEQMNRPFYADQKVPGFPEPTSRERIARMFQKGHIILRSDPAWGTQEEALAAERDTFVYTNAAPQVGFFNQGSRFDRPGEKGKLRWRAVETYILRNALTMRGRICLFAGPVFDDTADPPYRFGSKVPMRFWKIAVWSDGDNLRSIALLADQRPVLKVMPEAIGGEAFGDEEELARVSEFLSTVDEIETLTGLDFGESVRKSDIRAGMESTNQPALSLEPEHLSKPEAGRDGPNPRRGRKRQHRRKPLEG